MIQFGDFKSKSGKNLAFKIECDALTDKDWNDIALIVAKRVIYDKVIGIPNGGLKFAKQLSKYSVPGCNITLICDDVLTTGNSMKKAREQLSGNQSFGVVVFARSKPPDWILPIFSLTPMWKIEEYMHNEKLKPCPVCGREFTKLKECWKCMK